MVSPDPLFPNPTSAMKAPENIEDEAENPELVRDTQMEDSSVLVAQPKYMSSNKNYSKNLGQQRCCLIIQNFTVPPYKAHKAS